MNMMSRKKRYRFQVQLSVLELEHVPLVNQLVYTKVRLLDGGSFVKQSEKQKVLNQSVRWETQCLFECKMTANANTGELDSCMCRVSVRKELRGGKSSEKLGFADIDLAEFAGSGGDHRYLLQAYDTKHRLLNSTLTIAVQMTILSGDPCFKAKERSGVSSSSSTGTVGASSNVGAEMSLLSKDDSLNLWPVAAAVPDAAPPAAQGSHASLTSSGYNSLNKKSKEEGEAPGQASAVDLAGHTRNSSNTSHQSQASGYASENSGHNRSSSLGSPVCVSEAVPYLSASGRLVKASTGDITKESRVEATRVDAADIIDQIFQKTIPEQQLNESNNDSQDEPGLQLYLGVDGKPTVDSRGRTNSTVFKPVVVHKR
ncbi:EEIG1/EHBP1 N-terminal domain [Trinorchestia longiramus]|nr:EEIG1/EHBP1 N-terminal domain [Trinorchestia longiramus]